MSYSPQLNVRSAYNFQESLIKIPDYLAFCAEHGFSYAFYAEKFSMYGVAEFVKAAQKVKIKPLIGVTLELEDWTLILLAKNQKGYQQLCYISSWLTNQKAFSKMIILTNLKPYLTKDLILVANTATVGTFFENLAADDQYLNTIFLPRISYLNPNDFLAFQALKALKENSSLKNLAPITPESYPSDKELAIQTSLIQQKKLIAEIAAKINFELFPNSVIPNLVNFPTPNQVSAKTFLQQLTTQTLNHLSNHFPEAKKVQYTQRLEKELKIINQMGLENYFLVVWDYVRFARETQILVGPGRGSAASSLVCYLLQITQIDPLEYDLFFERFLNPERLTLPDIDIDFQDDRRAEVIQYLSKKYGSNHVATIVTYQTIGTKSALRDAGRVLEIELETINVLTKNIENQDQNNLERAISKNLVLQTYIQKYPQLFQIATALMGLPRQTGTHAAGLIITQNDLRDHLPVHLNFDGHFQTQFDMNYLEHLGLIKMDLLGLRTLTILQMIQANVWKNQGKKIIFPNLPGTDKETFTLLNQGSTSGIFQLESPGMTRVIQQMNLTTIADIAVASSLFRPGPQEMISLFLERKQMKTQKNSTWYHSNLAPILEKTYGIIVYQEQVIQILQKIGNFSLSKADLVRRAMSKKNTTNMDIAQKAFFQGAQKNGYQLAQAQEWWNWIAKFVHYGFNKAHAVAYSYLSYWLAYCKVHYPLEFYTALLNGAVGNEIKTRQYLEEVRQLQISIKGPTLKNFHQNYVSQNQTLYLPLVLIKGVGSEFIRKLQTQYQQNNDLFQSLFSFLNLMSHHGLTPNLYQALVKGGAFDFWGYSRTTLLENTTALFNFTKLDLAKENLDPRLFPLLNPLPDDLQIITDDEKAVLGFYLSVHPLATLKQSLISFHLQPLNLVQNNLGYHTIMIQLQQIRFKKDKRGEEMAFFEGVDEQQQLTITVFSHHYRLIKNKVQTNSILILGVRSESYQERITITFQKLIKVVKF